MGIITLQSPPALRRCRTCADWVPPRSFFFVCGAFFFVFVFCKSVGHFLFFVSLWGIFLFFVFLFYLAKVFCFKGESQGKVKHDLFRAIGTVASLAVLRLGVLPFGMAERDQERRSRYDRDPEHDRNDDYDDYDDEDDRPSPADDAQLVPLRRVVRTETRDSRRREQDDPRRRTRDETRRRT